MVLLYLHSGNSQRRFLISGKFCIFCIDKDHLTIISAGNSIRYISLRFILSYFFNLDMQQKFRSFHQIAKTTNFIIKIS